MKSFLLTLTGGGVAAITLFPFGIYFKKQAYLDNLIIRNHEKIHWKQQIEMFVAGLIMSVIATILMIVFSWSLWWLFLFIPFPFLFFYIEYVIEWFIKVILPPQGAYYDLSTEREAHNHDQNLDYLKTRKHFAWLKYMFHS